MTVKCAILEYDYKNPAPSYKSIDVNCDKDGKVLYGGGKRKSKNTPYLTQLHTVIYAFDKFSELIFPQLKTHQHHYELYLFGNTADETMLYLKYPQTITHFIIDDDLIADIHHLEWSYDHLYRYLRALESTTNSLSFFTEKGIGDDKFQKSFPAFARASDMLSDAIVSASQRITDNAGIIFKSGW